MKYGAASPLSSMTRCSSVPGCLPGWHIDGQICQQPSVAIDDVFGVAQKEDEFALVSCAELHDFSCDPALVTPLRPLIRGRRGWSRSPARRGRSET